MFARFIAVLCAIMLAACGGGSSGGGSVTPAGPQRANTSLSYYLPEAAGNSWTFSSGGSIRDLGSGSLNCGGCPIQGVAIESLGLYSPSGTSSGIFYYTKGTYPIAPLAGHSVTYLTGVSNDGGQTILLTAYSLDGTIPGLGAIDDRPQANETFFINSNSYGGSASATINSVGGTQPYGSAFIDSIAATTLSAPAAGVTIGFSFAQGVGFSSVSYQGQTITLTSFNVNTSSAHAVAREVKALHTLNASSASDSVVASVESAAISSLFH